MVGNSIMAILCVLILTSIKPAIAGSPSFDCKKARTTTEISICRFDELGSYDVALVELHGIARANRPDKTMFNAEHSHWLSSRDQCGSERACIGSQYLTRIRELTDIIAPSSDASISRSLLDDADLRNLERGSSVTAALGWCAVFDGEIVKSMFECSSQGKFSCGQECGRTATFTLPNGERLTLSGAEETFYLADIAVKQKGENCWQDFEGAWGFCFMLSPQPYMAPEQ